jgi:hypothetical protein
MITSKHIPGSKNATLSGRSSSLGTVISKLNYWTVPGTSICGHPIELINFVSHVTGIPYSDIVSKSQKDEIMDARHLAMYFIYAKFRGKYSLKSIAGMFGLISHATVLHSVKVTKNLRETDYEFRVLFEKIQEKINQ